MNNEELKTFHEVKEQEFKNKGFLLDKLRDYQIELQQSFIPKKELDSLIIIEFDSPLDHLLSIMGLILINSKIHSDNSLAIIYHANPKYSYTVNQLISDVSFIPIGSPVFNLDYTKLLDMVARELNQKVTLLNDFLSRLDFAFDSVVGIVIGENPPAFINNHPVIVYLSGKNIKISYCGERTMIVQTFEDSIRFLLTSHAENLQKNYKTSQVEILNSKVQQQLLCKWSGTDKIFPESKTIHLLFEEQVSRTPGNIAVIYEGVQLTYTQLNISANQLSQYLRITYAIKGDDLIAVCLDKSEHMLITILGVLKSGAAYVPIDPEYPDECITYMLKDIRAKVLLTNEVYINRFSGMLSNQISSIQYKEIITDILAVDSKSIQDKLSKLSTLNPSYSMTSHNLAYVIFTSGTTGKPKGVMVEHKSIVNLTQAFITIHQLDCYSKVAIYSNYVFDAFVYEVFPPLLNGNTLYLLENRIRLSLDELEAFIMYHYIQVIFIPSALLVEFLRILKVHSNKSIKIIYTGGDKLPLIPKDYLSDDLTLFNEYGPTEVSVCATYRRFQPGDLNTNIGRPIANITTYVLDINLKLLPIGIVGFLYLGGVGVARGYLNNLELTMDKFIANPFQTELEKMHGRNAKLYETGDLVRYLPDGNIEYMGRNDFQVKIRGLRIELSEIEIVLNKYPGVSHAVVVVHEAQNGIDRYERNKYLIAYYVAKSPLDENDILNYLSYKLPGYMLPSALIYLTALPLTINSKLDRAALPLYIPDSDKRLYVAPGNNLEKELCGIYAEELGLEVDAVGVMDDFWGLGGNSILAIKLVGQISARLNIKLAVSSLLQCKTIYCLAKQILSNSMEVIMIPNAKEKFETTQNDLGYKLSFAQERLWFIEQYEGGTSIHNLYMLFELKWSTNIEILERSLHSIINRHDILHSLIKADTAGNHYQIIIDTNKIKPILMRHSITSMTELTTMVSDELHYIYDLSAEYPIRMSIYTLDSGLPNKQQTNQLVNNDGVKYYLNIVIHHIAFDGWSVDVFMRDLQAYYNYYQDRELDKTTQLNLPNLSIQYKDFAVWQREYLSDDKLHQQMSYWIKSLSGYENLNLPFDKQRPLKIDYIGASEFFIIDEVTSLKLRKVAQKLQVSLYSLLLGGYYILLSGYSGQDDIVVGTPVANRHYKQLENLIGFFVNTLALRSILNHDNDLSEYIKKIGLHVIEAQLHQDLPFEMLINTLGVATDTSRHPIFQVMFGVQNFTGGILFNEQDTSCNMFKLCNASLNSSTALFDLTTMFDDSHVNLKGVINYATSLWSQSTILNFIKTYKHILTQIADLTLHKSMNIKQLSYLTQEDYITIVNTWNRTNKDYSSDKTIIQLFEEQVIKFPDRLAVIYGDTELTYQELNKKSNQMAHYLQTTYRIQGDDLIALCLDRSECMLIAILAVLKSGAAYVPIDPNYSDERISYILTDTQTRVVLTNEIYHSRCELIKPTEQATVITINSNNFKTLLSNYSITNLSLTTSASNLAYVIYTSGTTGKPKGVLQQHDNVVRLFAATDELYHFNHNDVWTLFHSYVFDFSVWEIWGALLYGGKLIIPSSAQVRDFEQFIALCKRNKVTVLNQTPQAFYQLIDITLKDQVADQLNNLRYVILGGDKLNILQLRPWFDNYGYTQPQLVNMYGITETTVHVTYKFIMPDDTGSSSFIGKAISDQKVYVLDSNLRPLPKGTIGELYIGGAGLARGYLNQQELTAKKFIVNPFQTLEEKQQNKNRRLYKTGDLVKYVLDGSLEYINRNDFQVKIRGFRVELGEIEYQLLKYADIKQALVLIQGDKNNNQQIIAYYVADNLLDETDILKYLSSKLPNYMIPMRAIHIKKIPLTINNKLDQSALPDASFIRKDNYIAPKNQLEQKICMTYAQVLMLDVTVVGISESFFKLGGNSILALKLKQQLNLFDEFLDITVADIFQYDSVQKLTAKFYDTNKSINNESDDLCQTYDHKIAIIGMSGEFSGASSIQELWDLILTQKEGICRYTLDECRALGVSETLLQNPNYIPAGGYITGVDLFDPQFWGMSVAEAKQTDPQIRKFLEHCWNVLERSGYVTRRKSLSIGVFAGSGKSDYFYDNILQGEDAGQINQWVAYVSNAKEALATKASYLLGLIGPANSINTACSTSLVTVVEACKSLALGACDMAIAGGVSLVMPEDIGYIYAEGMILSKDGYCRTFDKDASGTISGSGVGVVLLKRLAEAKKDGDHIIAVLHGYATGNDGDRKANYTAPSAVGQTECILRAQRMAEVGANDISYIECHGTATHLGDPIEIQALREAFKHNSNTSSNLSIQRKCILGSVKANVGHTDAAAGITGLIKACKVLQESIFPGQVNFSQANLELNLEQTNFEIIKNNVEYVHHNSISTFAGVNSFGIGGTNAHVVVSDYTPIIGEVSDDKKSINVEKSLALNFPMSAKNRKSLELYKQEVITYLSNHQFLASELANIAYTLQYKRDHFEYRYCVTATSNDDLIIKLSDSQLSLGRGSIGTKPNIIFMFPGQGMQYADMSVTLYCNENDFKVLVDNCINIAHQHVKVNLLQVLYPSIYGAGTEDINQTEFTQIALFVVSYALAKYLEMNGVKADAYIGHSIGEYVAATLSGVFSLEDAIRLVVARGKIMQAMDSGSMLAIQANYQNLTDVIAAHNCEIAAINSPRDVVISGTSVDIDCFKDYLSHNNISYVQLKTSHAYHSRMMEQAATKFIQEFNGIQLHRPHHRFISNIAGDWATEDVAQAGYWGQQLRQTVYFSCGIEKICAEYPSDLVFIEVGAGRSLGSFVNKYENKNKRSIRILQLLPTFKEFKEGTNNIFNKQDIANILWSYGVIEDFSWCNFFTQPMLDYNLPTYQFDYKSCWIKKVAQQNLSKEINVLPESLWYSSPIWQKLAILNKRLIDIPKFKNMLLFINKDQYDLVEKISIFASNVIEVILDYSIALCDFSTATRVIINPIYAEAYKGLADYLANQQIKIDVIIHGASIIENNSDKLFDCLDFGFYSLFLIKQNLLSRFIVNNLVVLTYGLSQITGQDVINPFNGAMVGALRNIKHELPNLNSLIIDTNCELESISAYLAQILSNHSYRNSEYLFAFKFGSLWMETFSNIQLQESVKLIKDSDTILITGGLGGVALVVATRISQEHKVNFILMSRNNIYDISEKSSYIQSKINLIEEIKSRGCHVEICCVDIANIVETRAAIEKISLNYTAITGIIHTAGVEPLANTEYVIENIRRVFRGKVYGIYNLLNCINKKNLRYLVSTSSLASVMGDINAIDYCASNSYLDYLCVDNLVLPNTRLLSINWPGWLDTGMVKNISFTDWSGTARNILKLGGVTNVEGGDIFYNALNQSNFSQIIVSKLDIESVRENLFNYDTSIVDNSNVSIIESNYSEIEYKVAQIFHEILGVEEISLYDDFFKLGGNSLLSLRLISKLSNIGINISLQDIVKHSNISLICVNSQTESDVSIVVALKINLAITTRYNMFFIHAVGGTVSGYMDIVEALPESYNYYGLQNINIFGQQLLKADSLEKLATIYLDEILKIQPSGEYVLCGSSMGGVIGYEIACQLKKQGRAVKFVAMFDSWAFSSAVFKGELEFRIRYAADLTKMEVSSAMAAKLIEARLWLMQLLMAYKPQSSNLLVDLYKAADLDEVHVTNGDHYDNCWQSYLEQPLRIFNIVGNHDTMHTGQGLEQICYHLRRRIENVT